MRPDKFKMLWVCLVQLMMWSISKGLCFNTHLPQQATLGFGRSSSSRSRRDVENKWEKIVSFTEKGISSKAKVQFWGGSSAFWLDLFEIISWLSLLWEFIWNNMHTMSFYTMLLMFRGSRSIAANSSLWNVLAPSICAFALLIIHAPGYLLATMSWITSSHPKTSPFFTPA